MDIWVWMFWPSLRHSPLTVNEGRGADGRQISVSVSRRSLDLVKPQKEQWTQFNKTIQKVFAKCSSLTIPSPLPFQPSALHTPVVYLAFAISRRSFSQLSSNFLYFPACVCVCVCIALLSFYTESQLACFWLACLAGWSLWSDDGPRAVVHSECSCCAKK